MRYFILCLLLSFPSIAGAFASTIMARTSKYVEQGKLPTWTMNSYSGDGYTTNVNNIKLMDGLVATSTGSFTTGSVVNLPTGTHGFTVPVGATITGVEVHIRQYQDSGGYANPTICILKGGIEQSNCKTLGMGVYVPNSMTTLVFGGPTDMWPVPGPGTPITLTPADVNATGFGVKEGIIWDSPQAGAKAVYTDFIYIVVYYTE